MAAGVVSFLAYWLGGAATVPGTIYTVLKVASDALTAAGATTEALTDASVTGEDLD